jgi:MFS superfamily sulfate permease-like transporter
MVVSYNMGEWSEIPKLLAMTWADISVWLVTFALTVFADLSLAVEVGMLLAAWLYIRKVTRTTTVSKVTSDYVEEGRLHILQDKRIPEHVRAQQRPGRAPRGDQSAGRAVRSLAWPRRRPDSGPRICTRIKDFSQ